MSTVGLLHLLKQWLTRADTYRRIARVDLKFPATISADAKDLVSKVSFFLLLSLQRIYSDSQLLQYDPQQRLPLTEVLVHPWIVKYRPKGTVRGSSSV